MILPPISNGKCAKFFTWVHIYTVQALRRCFFGKIVSCFVDFGKVVEIKMEYYFVAHSVSEVLSERNARNDLGKAIWTIYARKEALDQ